MYLIETSVIVDYLRKKKEAKELIESLDNDLCSSNICLSELYEGVYRSKDFEEAERGMLNFFSGLSSVWEVDQETAKVFGKLRSELKAKGNVLEDLDILIAATCIAHNLILVTNNKKHFKRVKGLNIHSEKS